MRIEKFKGVLLSTLVIASVVALALSFSSSGSASEPPNQSPIADFNFSPEHPREGANVYFFDSSYDPDGHIVEWDWSYSLWFGYPTFPISFEEGEQNKPNPTLNFEFEGGYPDEVSINLRVMDDDGAVNYVSHTIQTDMSPSSPSEPPIADFNFSPEQPTAGEEVYFFDSSYDPDGYIVEWYWYYSLNFGDDYWTCFMPFGNGEPNPTLTFDQECTAQITLVVMDCDGATDSASRIIEILPKAFSLATLYKVNLDVDLWLENNSKLVVKFYTWGDDFQAENVVWSGPAPDNVVLLEDIPHPQGKAVEKARLDLTHDNTENVISTLSTFTVCKLDLAIRFSAIPWEWLLAQTPEERLARAIEFSEIPTYWLLAPSC